MIKNRLVKHSFCNLVLAAAFAILVSCDGGGNDNTHNNDCLNASSNSNIIEEHIECPAEAVVQICTGFACTLDESAGIEALFFTPSDCTTSYCFNFSCDSSLLETIGSVAEMPAFGEYVIESVSGNTISGTVRITDEETQEVSEFQYSCLSYDRITFYSLLVDRRKNSE